MPAGQKRALGQFMMGCYRCGDCYGIDILLFIEIIQIVEKFCLGIIPAGLFQPISGLVANGGKLKIRIDMNRDYSYIASRCENS